MVVRRGASGGPGLATLSYFCLSPIATTSSRRSVHSPAARPPVSRRAVRPAAHGVWSRGDLMRGPLAARVRRLLDNAPARALSLGHSPLRREKARVRLPCAVPAIRKRSSRISTQHHGRHRMLPGSSEGGRELHGDDREDAWLALHDVFAEKTPLLVRKRVLEDTDDESDYEEDTSKDEECTKQSLQGECGLKITHALRRDDESCPLPMSQLTQ